MRNLLPVGFVCKGAILHRPGHASLRRVLYPGNIGHFEVRDFSREDVIQICVAQAGVRFPANPVMAALSVKILSLTFCRLVGFSQTAPLFFA